MRPTFAIMLSLMAVVLVGCTICQHPYDYCGPTFSGPGGQDPCLINERAGSAFTGTMVPPNAIPQEVEAPFSEPGTEQPNLPGQYETVPADGPDTSAYESSSTAPSAPVVQPVSGVTLRPTGSYRR